MNFHVLQCMYAVRSRCPLNPHAQYGFLFGFGFGFGFGLGFGFGRRFTSMCSQLDAASSQHTDTMDRRAASLNLYPYLRPAECVGGAEVTRLSVSIFNLIAVPPETWRVVTPKIKM